MIGITIEQLHSAILSALVERFSDDFQLISFYRDDVERRAPKLQDMPAMLLELTELEPYEDAGTEQLPVIARFELRIVLDAMQQQQGQFVGKIKIRALAAKVAHFLFQNKHFHRLPAGALSLDGIVEDAFYPELDRFEVWRIDFSLPILIGDDVWAGDGDYQPVYSWSPNIGNGHADDYVGVD